VGATQFPSNFTSQEWNAFLFWGAVKQTCDTQNQLDFVGSYGYNLKNQKKAMANLPFLNPQLALVIKNG